MRLVRLTWAPLRSAVPHNQRVSLTVGTLGPRRADLCSSQACWWLFLWLIFRVSMNLNPDEERSYSAYLVSTAQASATSTLSYCFYFVANFCSFQSSPFRASV